MTVLHADRQRQGGDRGRGEAGAGAQAAQRIAEVIERRPQVLPRCFDQESGQHLEPEPDVCHRPGGIAVAILEDERQLASVLVPELGRIEREQRPERSRAQAARGAAVSGHGVSSASTTTRWRAHR